MTDAARSAGDDLVRGFAAMDVSNVSDALDRLDVPGQCAGIRPLDRGFRITGRAFTIRYVPVGTSRGTVGDYIDDLEPGQVPVLDNAGRMDATVWGDLLTATAHRMGLAGTVIDGICRDSDRSIELGYPIFSRGHCWLSVVPTPAGRRTGRPAIPVIDSAGLASIRFMPEAEVNRRFNVRIPMREGITLSADVTLPGSLPAPAVVMCTPYGKTGERQSRRLTILAEGGYAAVMIDVRGRGDSDGVFEPYRNDGPDGAEVIAWAAAQEWCTGDVATYGGSYGGRIQWLAALEHPPALRAMVCVVTPSDPFVEIPTGLPSLMHVNWQRLTDGRTPQFTDDVDWMAVYGHRPLVTMDEAAGFVSANWRAELQHRTLDEWWEPVRYQHRIGEIDVPVMHISGWYDDEEIGTPANFAAMVAAGRAGQRLLMGPWGHAVNTTRTLGEVDFGPDALIDLDGSVLAFLDEHVKGKMPESPPATVRIFVMGVNEWRDAETWPPAGARSSVCYLSGGGHANSRFGDGRLVPSPVAGEQPPDEWTHDPGRPVPFITDASSAQIGGPDDYLGIESRGDVLVFTSEPLPEPLEIIGAVKVIAHVSTSATDSDVMAKLVDVHPDNFAQRLCDGMARLRYRNGFDRSEPVTPGDVYEVEIPMWDTCIRLPAGHRLRVEIASSAFPKYDVNLGTGGDMISETEGVPATNRLWHTADRPSRLILG